jgi:hypothetical protein
MPTNGSTIAGTGSTAFVDGPVEIATFYYPYDVVIDFSGNLYVCDGYNHRIRKIDLSGNVSTFAGSGTPGFRNSNSSSLHNPVNIISDSIGNIYFSETGNHVIRKIVLSELYPVDKIKTMSYIMGNTPKIQLSNYVKS